MPRPQKLGVSVGEGVNPCALKAVFSRRGGIDERAPVTDSAAFFGLMAVVPFGDQGFLRRVEHRGKRLRFANRSRARLFEGNAQISERHGIDLSGGMVKTRGVAVGGGVEAGSGKGVGGADQDRGRSARRREIGSEGLSGRQVSGDRPPPAHPYPEVGIARVGEGFVVILGIEKKAEADLFLVREAGGFAGLFAGFGENGQEKGGQNRNEGDHDKQLDEREARSGQGSFQFHEKDDSTFAAAGRMKQETKGKKAAKPKGPLPSGTLLFV